MCHRQSYLVFGINEPPERSQVRVVSSAQNAASLVHNWSVAPAEARADNDRSGVYLSQKTQIEVPSKQSFKGGTVLRRPRATTLGKSRSRGERRSGDDFPNADL